MERRQRAAQLGSEIVVPVLSGEVADFGLGSKAAEEGLRRPRGRPGLGAPPGRVEDPAEVPSRLRPELRPPMRLGPADHVTQRPLGRRHLALGHEQHRCDPQILRLAKGVGQVAADLPHLVQLAPRQLQLAAGYADVGPPPESHRPEGAIPRSFGFGDRLIGLRQSAVERPLLAIRDPQVVVALGDALPQTGFVKGGRGHLPGPDRLGVPPPEVADDPQVVGAAADRGAIAIAAGSHERPREVVPRLVDPPADQGDSASRIEGLTLERPLLSFARLFEGQIEPPQALLVAPEPPLRGPVQQREARRFLQLAPPAGGKVLDHLGVVSRRGELSSLVDYERRRGHGMRPPRAMKPPCKRASGNVIGTRAASAPKPTPRASVCHGVVREIGCGRCHPPTLQGDRPQPSPQRLSQPAATLPKHPPIPHPTPLNRRSEEHTPISYQETA